MTALSFADQKRLKDLQHTQAWLKSRLNAATDPTVQQYLAKTKEQIAEIRHKDRRK